jgi:hypothetical protein
MLSLRMDLSEILCARGFHARELVNRSPYRMAN